MKAVAILAVVALAGCGGGPSGGGAALRSVSLGGTCPAPDPVRDGPLVDAIRRGDAGPVRAALVRNAGDTRAAAALAVIGGGRPDADEAACFAPYLA